tara:strand:+ start:378 stop:641 length:264 start_codon:yes stop_codon:yes gene_type:complete
MGTAFSSGRLELTMEDVPLDSSSLTVHVEAIAHEEKPGGLALHTSAAPEKGSVISYKFNHLCVVVLPDGSSQLFDLQKTQLEAIESV